MGKSLSSDSRKSAFAEAARRSLETCNAAGTWAILHSEQGARRVRDAGDHRTVRKIEKWAGGMRYGVLLQIAHIWGSVSAGGRIGVSALLSNTTPSRPPGH